MKNLKDLKALLEYEIQGDYVVINNKDYLIQEGVDFICGQSQAISFIVFNNEQIEV